MSPGNRDERPTPGGAPLREDSREGRIVPAPFARDEAGPVLERLRERFFWIAGAALVGGILGFALSKLETPTYRASASLLAVEPRIGGSGGSVDFNLTPIRSYTALLASPSVCAACAEKLSAEAAGPRDPARLASRLRVRMPENTRLLELSFESTDPSNAADFVSCVAERASAENRRINEEIAERTRDSSGAANLRARDEASRLEKELVDLRRASHLEVRRSELKAALAEVEAGATDERTAALTAVEQQEKRKSYEATARQHAGKRSFASSLAEDAAATAARDRAGESARPGSAVLREEAEPVRDFAEEGIAESAATEAGARASATEARRRTSDAIRRAVKLEEEIAKVESSLTAASKRFDGAMSALSEIERRRALAPLEAATKAFELVPFATAARPAFPSRPRPRMAGAAGALAAASFAALLVLSAPRRRARPGQDEGDARS